MEYQAISGVSLTIQENAQAIGTDIINIRSARSFAFHVDAIEAIGGTGRMVFHLRLPNGLIYLASNFSVRSLTLETTLFFLKTGNKDPGRPLLWCQFNERMADPETNYLEDLYSIEVQDVRFLTDGRLYTPPLESQLEEYSKWREFI